MVKVFHAFSGIDSQLMAEKRVWGEDSVRLIGTMEVDIDAIISSALIHKTEEFYKMIAEEIDLEKAKTWLKERNIGYDFNKNKSKIDGMRKIKLKQLFVASLLTKNYGDISLANKTKMVEDIDLFIYSSCCQSFSVAGKQEGLRGVSGLLLECEEFIRINKPKVLILENVKNLVGKKFKKDFDNWLAILDNLGYSSYWEVINAADFDIPQCRERVFCVSIRKDCDRGGYIFPIGIPSGVTLKTVLDDVTEDKYYYKDNQRINRVLQTMQKSEKSQEAKTTEGFKPQLKRLGGLFDDTCTHQAGSIWDTEGLSPTLDTAQGGWRQPLIFTNNNHSLRRLTPREYWKLMDFDDGAFDKVCDYMSDTQLYKQAGNSIVVSCMEYIFRELKKEILK